MLRRLATSGSFAERLIQAIPGQGCSMLCAGGCEPAEVRAGHGKKQLFVSGVGKPWFSPKAIINSLLDVHNSSGLFHHFSDTIFPGGWREFNVNLMF